MSILLTALALIAVDAPVTPRVFEKTRSDGVTVVCVRHVRKPTVFTARTECKPASRWSAARDTASSPQINSPAGTYSTEFAFSVPKATPRLIGK